MPKCLVILRCLIRGGFKWLGRSPDELTLCSNSTYEAENCYKMRVTYELKSRHLIGLAVDFGALGDESRRNLRNKELT